MPRSTFPAAPSSPRPSSPDVHECWGQHPLERFTLNDTVDKDLEELRKVGYEISSVQFAHQEHTGKGMRRGAADLAVGRYGVSFS